MKVDVKVSKLQVEQLKQLYAAVKKAQGNFDVALLILIAGEGYERANLLAIGTDSITIEVEDGEEDSGLDR